VQQGELVFSFFNSLLTSRSSPHSLHAHTGTVLSHAPTRVPVEGGWNWSEGVQVFHLLVSFLVFASIVVLWLPVPRGLPTALQMSAKAFVDTPRTLPPPSALCPTTTLHSPKECEDLHQHPTPSNTTLCCPKECEGFVDTLRTLL
jgi:hypothetical protein